MATESSKAFSGKKGTLICDNKCLLHDLSSETDEKNFSQSDKYLSSLKLFKICQMFIKYLVVC